MWEKLSTTTHLVHIARLIPEYLIAIVNMTLLA